VIVAGAWVVMVRPARDGAMGVGERVFHDKFGYGTVTAAEEDRLDIEFDKAGAKRVLDRFVRKASDV
jgi:DNA helicase-2/ATP-dependent DNA helicase PcrA